MKTSELKKIVKENNFIFENEDGCILITSSINRIWYLKFVEGNIFLNSEIFIRTKEFKNCIRALLDYSETPISEREEEKKYNLVLSEHFEIGWQTLNYEVEKNCYIFHSKSNSTLHTTEFTDKEISEMPIEIQKAIECGFLKKVEVKE